MKDIHKIGIGKYQATNATHHKRPEKCVHSLFFIFSLTVTFFIASNTLSAINFLSTLFSGNFLNRISVYLFKLFSIVFNASKSESVTSTQLK
ncbi:MAG: hypothetical protein U9Q66_00085 [Patescibacteria group bacterium]|nr:hypothetical protein [Patescibacteria group bacterium]